ncbi:hypothetical protein Tco_1374919 [Tanacetum coccineum]
MLPFRCVVLIFGGVTWATGSLTRFLALGWHLEGIHVTWAHLEKKYLTERRDGVTSIKRRRWDPSSDGVRDLVTATGCSGLNEDLESST